MRFEIGDKVYIKSNRDSIKDKIFTIEKGQPARNIHREGIYYAMKEESLEIFHEDVLMSIEEYERAKIKPTYEVGDTIRIKDLRKFDSIKYRLRPKDIEASNKVTNVAGFTRCISTNAYAYYLQNHDVALHEDLIEPVELNKQLDIGRIIEQLPKDLNSFIVDYFLGSADFKKHVEEVFNLSIKDIDYTIDFIAKLYNYFPQYHESQFNLRTSDLVVDIANKHLLILKDKPSLAEKLEVHNYFDKNTSITIILDDIKIGKEDVGKTVLDKVIESSPNIKMIDGYYVYLIE